MHIRVPLYLRVLRVELGLGADAGGVVLRRARARPAAPRLTHTTHTIRLEGPCTRTRTRITYRYIPRYDPSNWDRILGLLKSDSKDQYKHH